MGAVVLLAAGCCDKYKCGGPVAEIVVRDQAGALPPGTMVQSGGHTTQRYCRDGRCAFWVTAEGPATITAPGHKSVLLQVERQHDDCGNGLSQQVEVVLVPETSTEESVTQVGAALGCS